MSKPRFYRCIDHDLYTEPTCIPCELRKVRDERDDLRAGIIRFLAQLDKLVLQPEILRDLVVE